MNGRQNHSAAISASVAISASDAGAYNCFSRRISNSGINAGCAVNLRTTRNDHSHSMGHFRRHCLISGNAVDLCWCTD